MSNRLHNYLQTHRKKTGFSQREIACLLNCKHGAAVSRYERRARKPSLETALSLEAIYGVPIRELYAGVYGGVKKSVASQAKKLKRSILKSPKCDLAKHQIKLLNAIIKAVND